MGWPVFVAVAVLVHVRLTVNEGDDVGVVEIVAEGVDVEVHVAVDVEVAVVLDVLVGVKVTVFEGVPVALAVRVGVEVPV